MARKIVVFVHGWSVTNTDTYGELPTRLATLAAATGLDIDIQHIYLGAYVSFRDEVTVTDISRTFEFAIRDRFGDALQAGDRLICITHSTGGPVIRDWWYRFYGWNGAPCPMSHLVMLAPANFGSALAILGQNVVGRLKALFSGVEPGTRVLDWLQLGSPESIALNLDIARLGPLHALNDNPLYSFVLTGQCIDHALYDHVNSYTGELGSDGVVRVASANINATFVKLLQHDPVINPGESEAQPAPLALEPDQILRNERICFRLIEGRAHSGEDIGIMRSVREDGDHPTLGPLLRCLAVETAEEYEALYDAFQNETEEIRDQERLETRNSFFGFSRYRARDQFAMIVIRVWDSDGDPVSDFDAIILGPGNEPSNLPSGFFVDRQRNPRAKNTVTLYVNADVLFGVPPLLDPDDDVVRPKSKRVDQIGLRIIARPQVGLAHYGIADLVVSPDVLDAFLRPDQTTVVDIHLMRIVRSDTFKLLPKMDPDSGNYDITEATRTSPPI